MSKRLIYLILVTVLFSACSTTKFLPEGQKLYTGSKVNIEDKSISKGDAKALSSEMQALIRPKPNSSILGLRVKLWLYFKTKSRSNFIKRFFSKYGEPPVLISQVDLEKNSSIMQNRLENESYFQATVSGDTVGKKKTAKAIFTALPGPSYKIRNVSFPSGTSSLDTAVAGTASETLLKSGDKYNLDIIKSERIRIDSHLKEEGFFYFAPEDLIIKVDSTIADHHVDLLLRVKSTTSDKAGDIYTINKIFVYPTYSLRDTSLKKDQVYPYRWYNIIDPKHSVSPFLFANTVLLHPGDVYSRTVHNNSLNRFINLGPFSYVKNRFEDVSTADSNKLDVYYFLTQYKRKSLQAEILGRTTSANYTGTQLNLSWKNRNAFKGGEALTVTLFGSTDVQFSGQNSGYNVYQAGIQTTLSWPRIILSPFKLKADNAYIPRTNLSLSYTLVNRQKLYSLNSFTASFGYQWKSNEHVTNELNLTNINYTSPTNISQEYRDSIRNSNNPALGHVIDKQFTFGPSYSYTYTNTTETYKTNTFYYNGKVSLSANLYGLATGADTLAGKVRRLFGTPFNQFAKLENEIRFYHKTGANSSIASRLLVGIGYPYGNSTVLPYSQQFFIGGTNSLRGFRARSIGPGTYLPEQNTGDTGFLPDESGDIKIEANLEYRPKLFSIVRGALFVDAGNIWLLNSNPSQPGGEFTKKFLGELAADAGVGLRFDLSVLVLRTDLAFPIRKPYLPEGQRWVINKIDFGSSEWRRENLVFNLAIGYPF
ncbi:translocation and assembly module lipoprotein TamL [Mucilaginibacter segetis]|uniref:BamA/TamA family outer membrane protein n=1 Tax=Mucilaginibacter segetis TaxID=2793071 RepID=A0A934PS07_9SPHI|nr:BamA/TamA family outer membrane protein [Mucilaginibacter segetis]MBK0378146.1 BamA/TamA family outer membrane protein [Mucilaginibacter segetis]